MLDFVLLNDNKVDYKKLFKDIDNKIYQLSRIALYNSKYGLTDKVNYKLVRQLTNYKEILKSKLIERSSFCNYDLEVLVARVRRLINLDGPLPEDNNLTGCLNGQC